MSETTELLDTPATETRPRKASGGLSGMVLVDLKALAGQLGIKGTSGMRKGDLVAAITARQSANSGSSTPSTSPSAAPAANGAAVTGELDLDLPTGPAKAPARRRTASRAAGAPSAGGGGDAAQQVEVAPAPPAGPDHAPQGAESTDQPTGTEREPADGDRGDRNRRNNNRRNRRERDGEPRQDAPVNGTAADSERAERNGSDTREGVRDSGRDGNQGGRQQGQDRPAQNQGGNQNAGNRADRQDNRDGNRQDGNRQDSNRQDTRQDSRQDGNRQDSRQDSRDDDDADGRGGRRNRRFRDRNRRGTRERFAEPGEGRDPEVREDDVLVPVAGILDVLDSYAFIRTSGYLSGPNDIYVSLSQVRKNGLRRGDAVTGMVRAPRDGEQQRQKFNALVRLDSVNGLEPEAVRNRPEFTKLTPLYPNERLRLETESHLLTTRVIDLVMPVGKGQRALIVSPPKAGKTMVMQAIANAITTNNPECHLMVVLVDERPEEVTDMQRSVKGEVIASTFDRPPADHTMVAELSIERAKRLVEMGRDVVVLLDSITRLGRAYNLAAPASGRILSGGVDSTALFPPKRFLGAARNIENGGSLTIFASALVETGSAGDTVIFEEFKGTGNAELKLDRRLADKRIFPAIDVDQSSTRKEDLLLSPDELAITVKLRRVLAALDAQQALELVLDRLRKSRSNIEFLMQVAKSTPGND